MADISKATPRPWFQGEGDVNQFDYDPQLHIFSQHPEDGSEIVSLADLRIHGDCAGDDEIHPTRAVSRANAALIVEAVNRYSETYQTTRDQISKVREQRLAELVAALRDAKATLEEAAKLLAPQYPSVANNIVNQCAIRAGDALAKVPK